MIPYKPGIYWVRLKTREIDSDLKEGTLRDWIVAEYEGDYRSSPLNSYIKGDWYSIGSEVHIKENLVAVIGPELTPPDEQWQPTATASEEVG